MPNTISGPFTTTYNAKALGQTEQGFYLSHQFFKRMINSDEAGDAPIDGIYRGRAQFCRFTLIEALSAGISELIEPYATVPGTPFTMGRIGALDVGNGVCPGSSKQLIMTAVAGGCAAAAGPLSMTFPNTIIAEDFPVEIMFGNDLRKVPVRVRMYPDDAGVFGTVLPLFAPA